MVRLSVMFGAEFQRRMRAVQQRTVSSRTGGICPYNRARQAAQSAHLLIVNHALLLSDVATGNRVLPDYDVLIVDEAHHIEDATTNALSYRLTQADIEHMLRELGGSKSGAMGWLLAITQDLLSPGDYASLHFLVDRATDLAFQFENLARGFFTAIDKFLFEQRDGRPIGYLFPPGAHPIGHAHSASLGRG